MCLSPEHISVFWKFIPWNIRLEHIKKTKEDEKTPPSCFFFKFGKIFKTCIDFRMRNWFASSVKLFKKTVFKAKKKWEANQTSPRISPLFLGGVMVLVFMILRWYLLQLYVSWLLIWWQLELQLILTWNAYCMLWNNI